MTITITCIDSKSILVAWEKHVIVGRQINIMWRMLKEIHLGKESLYSKKPRKSPPKRLYGGARLREAHFRSDGLPIGAHIGRFHCSINGVILY